MASRQNSDSLSNDLAPLQAAHLLDRLMRLSRNGVAFESLNPAQWEALRYIERANRFSRTPAALSDYVGSTRGTVSQTLIALEQKGFVSRQPSARDKRSIQLELTDAGIGALAYDPLLEVANDIGRVAGGVAVVLVETLRSILQAAIKRNGSRAFGACHTCKFFQSTADGGMPHFCGLLGEPLTVEDSTLICLEQVSA